MIPKSGWRSMDEAPKDGTIIVVRYSQYNGKSGPDKVQFCHWLCDDNGEKWGWKRPWGTGHMTYADVWMPVTEFYTAQEIEASEPEFDL